MSKPATDEIPKQQFDILHHSLGMVRKNYRRKLDWWLDNENHRNHFATAPDCDHYGDCVALETRGLMKRGRQIPGGLTHFHVTPDGIKFAKQNRPEW